MAVETMQARAAEKDQKVELDVAPSTGFVFGDVRLLRESIEHVLDNAIAYSDKKGRIRVEVSGDDQQAVIRIIDDGIGISKQDLPRVFERFDRINEAGVRGEAALGLGLPLTRQFLEAHGGSVELESKKGKGTVVTLIIPRGAK